MGWSESTGLGVRFCIILILMAAVAVGVVGLTVWDTRRMEVEVERDITLKTAEARSQLAAWYSDVGREYARQMAAPFLWDIETLEGVEEGTPVFNRLQKRMWQFVFGRDTLPLVSVPPVGPLESVVIIGLDHRIVAASDVQHVDKEFTDLGELEILNRALKTPQIRELDRTRNDDRKVFELTVGVPNSQGQVIGLVRMRYVGGAIASPPELPMVQVHTKPRYWGPALAGFLAFLGLGFGSLATYEVISLNRRLLAMVPAEQLPEGASGRSGMRALSMLEDRLEELSDNLRRDDLVLESLTEALREGVVLFDREGQPEVANRQARQILGLDDPACPTLRVAFPALAAANPELGQLVDGAFGKGQVVREMPMTISRPGRDPIVVQVTNYVLHDGREPAGLLLVLKDRGSIETLERNLREASRLHPIVLLTGSVAHELKNPLHSIGIHVETLERRLGRLQEADPGASERLRIIREEIDRLREVLEEWLRLTGPEERVPATTSPAVVIQSISRLLRVEARHRNVQLRIEIDGDPQATALPAARLKQVLLNLALNGLEAMPDGGMLILRASQAGGTVLVQVADTGPGIPAAVADRIFELHFTTKDHGSGLGLAICKQLVEESGGTIGFHSLAGDGTTFFLKLPVAGSGSSVRPDHTVLGGAKGTAPSDQNPGIGV